jgi:hypothetical protein
MSCAMVYWNTNIDTFLKVFNEFGAVVDLRPLEGRAIGETSRLHQPKLFDDV